MNDNIHTSWWTLPSEFIHQPRLLVGLGGRDVDGLRGGAQGSVHQVRVYIISPQLAGV